jgi:hypothetical protein
MGEEKYKELYQLSQKVLEHDEDRFTKIDDKASRYSSALIVAISVVGIMCKWSLDNYLPLRDLLDIIGISSVVFLIAFLATAWFFLLLVWKVKELKKCL